MSNKKVTLQQNDDGSEEIVSITDISFSELFIDLVCTLDTSMAHPNGKMRGMSKRRQKIYIRKWRLLRHLKLFTMGREMSSLTKSLGTRYPFDFHGG